MAVRSSSDPVPISSSRRFPVSVARERLALREENHMSVQLNHTIVSAHDKHASAAFLAEILGLEVGKETPPFVPLQLENGVTLDYMDRQSFTSQHYAFLVDDGLFDAAH